LQTRLFALCILSMRNLALALVSVPVAAVVSVLLWLPCWKIRVTVPLLGRRSLAVPIAVIALSAALLEQWRLGGVSAWTFPLSLCIALIAVWVRYALRSVTHVVRGGDGWRWALPAFCFALVWRLLSGIGYVKGWLRIVMKTSRT